MYLPLLIWRRYMTSWNNSENENDVDVWVGSPTPAGAFTYSLLTPFISLFGICGNGLSLIVLIRKEFKASIYTYLCVLAAADLIDSMLIFISGLCRGVLWGIPKLSEFEAIITMPLGGMFSTLAVIATVGVALDRVVYLWNPRRFLKPKFCKRRTARKIMFGGFIISVVVNIPYCFMYEWTDDGKLVTSKFYHSKSYAIFTWVKFILFAIIPAIFLAIGNGFLIYTVKKAHRIKKKCQRQCNMVCRKDEFVKDQRLVTLTLITVVFFFLVAEIPSQIASRKTAVVILFHGDEQAAETSKPLEIYRQIVTVLNATSIAVNFLVYCLFCPIFRRNLSELCSCNHGCCQRAQGQNESGKLKLPRIGIFFLRGNTSDDTSNEPKLVQNNDCSSCNSE